MRWYCYGTLGIIVICAVGCVSQTTPISLSGSPSTLPSPTFRPTETLQPTATNTVILQPSPIPSPVPSPTLTYPPYADNPFTIIFLRNGNLWLSEIGGSGERQLTTEPIGWAVNEYAMSPECNRIAYISYHGPPSANAVVKQVNVSSGIGSALAGENDPYIEYSLEWLDSNHIAFSLSEFTAPGYDKGTPVWDGVQPFHHIVVDLTTGERVFVPNSLVLSQSPNGRYWVTCSRGYVYEGACEHKLHDLETGDQWAIAEGIGWGAFIGWSPDSKRLLFTAIEDPEDATIQLVTVDATTHQERPITPNNVTVIGADWSPDSQTIVFTQCKSEGEPHWIRKDCALWLMSPEDTDARRISVEDSLEAVYPTWIPDGSRIVFAIYDKDKLNSWTIWSIRMDGSDLRPIVSNADSGARPIVLCNPKSAG